MTASSTPRADASKKREVAAPTTLCINENQTASMWEPLAARKALPHPRYHAATAVTGDKVYLFGGRASPLSTAKCFNDLYVFDPVFSDWAEVVPADDVAPTPRCAHTLTVSNDKSLLLLGGCGDGNNALNDLWKFSVDTATWTRVKTIGTDKPKALYSHTAVIYKDAMYVYGGWTPEWSKNEKLYKLNLNSFKWEVINYQKGAVVPDRRFGHVAAVHQDAMIVFGGAKSVGATNEIWRFSFSTEKWTQLIPTATGPSARKGMTAVKFGSQWLVVGGCANDEVSYSDAWQFDFDNNSWIRSASFKAPVTIDSHCCTLVERAYSYLVLLVGGRVKKSEATNEAYFVSLFKQKALAEFEENNAKLKAVQDQITVPIVTLEECADVMSPITSNRAQFASQLSEQIKSMTGTVPTNESDAKVSANDGALETYKRICSIYRRFHDLEIAVKATADPDMESQVLQNSLTQKLESFLSSAGCEDGVLTKVPSDFGANPNALAPVINKLSPTTIQVLKRITEPTKTIDANVKQFFDSYVGSALEALKTTSQKYGTTIAEKHKESDDIVAAIKDTSCRMMDASMSIREKRALSDKRCELSVDLLLSLDAATDEFKATLDAPPTAFDVASSPLTTASQTFLDGLKEREGEIANSIENLTEKQNDLAKLLDKTATEVEEAEALHEEKRAGYAERRGRLVTDLQTYVSKTLEEYNKIIEEEKADLMIVEKKRREENETKRQVAALTAEMIAPIDESRTTKEAFALASEFSSSVHGSIQQLLAYVQKHSSKVARELVKEIDHNTSRFLSLVRPVVEELSKTIHTQQSAMKKIEGCMESMLVKLDLLEGAGDPEEMQSEEESTTRELLSGFSAGEVNVDNDATPYQKTLQKHNAYTQLFEKLQSEMELNRERVAQISRLVDESHEKNENLKKSNVDNVDPSSLLRAVFDEDEEFDWQSCSATPETSNEEWLQGFWNIDPATLQAYTSQQQQQSGKTRTSAAANPQRAGGPSAAGAKAAHRNVKRLPTAKAPATPPPASHRSIDHGTPTLHAAPSKRMGANNATDLNSARKSFMSPNASAKAAASAGRHRTGTFSRDGAKRDAAKRTPTPTPLTTRKPSGVSLFNANAASKPRNQTRVASKAN